MSSSSTGIFFKAPCPDIPDDGCSICGSGKCVTDFDSIFAYPSQPAVECGVLEKAGHGGVIPLDQCKVLPKLVKNDCKCQDGIPITPQPTPKPTRSPTRRPTPSPTRSSSSIPCPDIPGDGCSVCGPDKCVTDFDKVFAYPGQPEVECGVLEKAGHGGVIPLDQCVILPKLIKDKCKCRSSIPATSKPTHMPTPSPTRATTSGSSACPDIPDGGCSICGPEKCVTEFDTIFSYPGQPEVECGILEKAGHGGVIPLDQCKILPKLIKNGCGCRSSIPAASQPTPNPTRNPTRRPTPSPTKPSKPSGTSVTSCLIIPDDVGCSVCGPGKCVTDLESIFSYPSQPSISCGLLENAGHSGIIPLDQCAILPDLIKDDCKCHSGSEQHQSSPTKPPTRPEWPRITYPPMSTPISAASFAGPTIDSSSDGATIGLAITACLVGIGVIGFAVYLLRKKKKVKDASTVGIVLEADGSSTMKSRAARVKRSKALQEAFEEDPDLF